MTEPLYVRVLKAASQFGHSHEFDKPQPTSSLEVFRLLTECAAALSPPEPTEGLRATLLNIQAMAERGFRIDNAKLSEQCKHALRAMPLQDHAADEREACAKVADDWLSAYGNRNPKFVDAQTWACDAVRDIADAIRQRRAMVAEQETK